MYAPRKDHLVCILTVVLALILSLAAVNDYKHQLTVRDAMINTQVNTIKAQDATIAAQVLEIRNLRGTVRDNLRTIEQLLGSHPEQPSRGHRGERRQMTVTAYTAADWPDNPAYGITAAGHRLTDADAWRVAAADPEHYPAGTRIYVAGVGLVTVKDTGSDVQGPDRLDVFVGMENRAEAFRWGRKTVPVMIVK